MSSLRQVPWPTLPCVDLATEFHWLIRPGQNERGSGAHRHQHEASVASGNSPYEQLLNRPRDARPPLSPQQQAAKTITRLKQEMLHPSSKETLREDLAIKEQNGAAYLRTLISHSTAVDGQKPRANDDLLRRKSPAASKAVVRSQSAHKKRDLEGKSTAKPQQKRRPESRQGSANLRAKQKQLASWLSKDARLNKPSEPPDLFSMEVDWRIHAAMTDHTGEGLWRDQVASVIAAEMTSESVFGGFIPTRRLALHPSPPKAHTVKSEAMAEHASKLVEPTSCDEPIESTAASSAMHVDEFKPSLMAIVANEIREEAREKVAQGAVDEALLTLEHGIRHILEDFQDNQDEIQAHGFNFSLDAHEKATRVQLKYRARHRDRVLMAITLQRVWRAVHRKKAALAQAKYEARNAQAIQRLYKRHYNTRRREQSACRIQRCFRIYQEQKHFIHLLQACRYIVAQERRRIEKIKQFEAMKKRLWVKLRTALRVIWLWRMRRRGLTCLQKRWKGAKARNTYALVLAKETANELYRLEREQAFVNARVGRAMGFYEQFLRQTQHGRALVSWQTKRPFIRWNRRRKEWSSMDRAQQIPLLCALYAPKQRVKGAELRAIWQLLNAQDELYQHAHELNLSPSALAYLLQPAPPNCDQVVNDSTSRWRIVRWFHRMRRSFAQYFHTMVSAVRRFGLLAFWNLVLMPRKYHFERRSKPNRQRALETLKFTQQQILTKFLRQLFRRLEDVNRPKYACALCCMAFGTAKGYYAHLNQEGNCRKDFERAQQEWEELRRDVSGIGRRQTLMAWEHSARFEPGQGRFPTGTSKRAFLLLVQMAEACSQVQTTGTKQIAPELVGFLRFVLRKDQQLLFLLPSHTFVHWSVPSLPFESNAQVSWPCREEIQSQQCMTMIVGSLVKLVQWVVQKGFNRCRRLASVMKPGSAYKTQPVPSTSATVVPVI